MDWYYVEDGKSVGPFTDDAWDELVQKGKVTTETMVWNESQDRWKPYREIGFPHPPSSTSMPRTETGPLEPGYSHCAQCGKAFPQEDMMKFEESWVCVDCKPVFLQKLREGVRMPTAVVFGGFWVRLGAKTIDLILLLIVNYMFVLPLFTMLGHFGPNGMGIVFFIQFLVTFLLIPAAFSTFFMGKYGATPGKMACRLQVVTSDGNPLGYSRAFARFSAEIISAVTVVLFFTVGFGYLIAAFDEEKKTLHDRICDTRVIRTP